MVQYIDKSALVAEIENLLDKGKYNEEYDCAYRDGNNGALYALKNKLDTFEVKEVDLDKDVDRILEEFDWKYDKIDFYEFAKHFFELGIKASNTLTWEDINLIDHLLFDIKEDYNNGKLDKEEYYKEVLKKFKAQL